jgi:hypothetical protein
MLHKKDEENLKIVKNVGFKVDLSLVSGSGQWCDPGSVRFFSIFLALRLLQQWGEVSPEKLKGRELCMG